MKPWFVYLVRCADGSLYTGITTDLALRIAKHNAGQGAKYTRGKTPVVLVWRKKAVTESQARKQEAQLKKLSKPKKEAFILSERRQRGR